MNEQKGAVVVSYPGKQSMIGGEVYYDPVMDKTFHRFTQSAKFEPIRRSTLATRWACKALSICESLNMVPKLPAIQNWWSAHKASDAARGLKSGGGGC
jgi:hypothetical protein